MNFKMNISPRDEKIFHGETMNVVTFGRGSYSSPFSVTVQFGNMNILSGRFCSLAGGIYFSMGGNHPVKSVTTSPIDVANIVKGIFGKVRPKLRPIPDVRIQHRQIILGHDVWIGDGATIMGGVKIGNGAVIGAKAVVAKDIPPYAIVVGNPVRVIKYRFDEETIKKFLAVKWWNWSLEKIADNFPLMNDVENFLEAHYSPALEEFPEDDFSRQINNFPLMNDVENFLEAHYSPALEEFPEDEFSRQINNFGGGCYRTYHFIPDFQAKDPLWSKVVADFCQSNLENSLLVIWLGKDASDDDIKSLTEAVGSNQNIITFRHEENFSPCALRQGTHFITTREMSTLEALDYLWNTDVKIVSALDNGIF